MIEIDKTDIVGISSAIRGMRNPMNSWCKSDSYICDELVHIDVCRDCELFLGEETEGDTYYCADVFIGENDLSLMKKLSNAGTDHRKFMRMITVYADITAPLYWYKEYDTYKVGTVANSCSTMHKIHSKEFTLDDFSCEHLAADSELLLLETIKLLNEYREDYISTKDKLFWWQMIQLLPSSYNQKRTVMLNYEVLSNIYKSRKAHKLDEWVEFCKWIETLPYSELITNKENK